MRILRYKCLLAVCVVLLAGTPAAFAWQAFSPPLFPGQNPEGLSEQQKIARINQLLYDAYLTDDPVMKIELYDQVLRIDPTNATAQQGIAKAQAELEKRVAAGRQLQDKAAARKAAEDALAADDDAKIDQAIVQLDEALKTNPGDKELESDRQRIKNAQDQRKVSQQTGAAIKKGGDALLQDDTAALNSALQAIDEALKTNSGNATLGSLKGDIERRIRTARTIRILKIVAVITAIVSVVGISLFLLLRKRKGLLELVDGERAGEVFPLDKPAIKIGALTDGNDLVVSDRKGKISRFHCEIVREGRRYFIKDVSTNGTWVNEQYLEAGQPKVLRKGDRLSLAGELTMIFRLK